MAPTMLHHLLELRRRIILVLVVFSIFFSIYFIFRTELFHLFVTPLLTHLPTNSALIVTEVTASVLTPLSLAANAALLSTSPFALFHFWRFLMPGLYPNERRRLKLMIVTSMLLFSLGFGFCFYLVLPFMFQFFVMNLPADVLMMPDIRHSMHFITKMLIIFGISFQLPLVCFMLVRLGWVDIGLLQKIRPYVIVGAFVIGMLLTPPDVLSQILLAVPLCLLYELGILLAKLPLGRS
jgi:sec-independent protein translocase protein TatC